MKRVWCVLVSLLLPALAWSAVTFDQAVSANTGLNLSAGITYTMTVAAGSNRVLMVALCTANGAINEVATATFDEEPLTLVADIHSINTIARAHLYVLVNPPAVTGSVDFTLTGATTRRMASGAIALQGAHQTTPHDTAVTAQNAALTTTLSVSVATVTDDMIVDVLCQRDTNYTLTMDAGTGRTQRYMDATTNTSLGNNVRAAGSTRTGTGTLAMGWTSSGQVGMAEVGVNINTAPAAPVGRALSLGIRMLQ